jgi:hypothetical protein
MKIEPEIIKVQVTAPIFATEFLKSIFNKIMLRIIIVIEQIIGARTGPSQVTGIKKSISQSKKLKGQFINILSQP